jgi:hypothetical protein
MAVLERCTGIFNIQLLKMTSLSIKILAVVGIVRADLAWQYVQVSDEHPSSLLADCCSLRLI